MWSGSNQRTKDLMRAREREKTRLSRPIHILRADIKLQFKDISGNSLEVKARALLNDFSNNGIVLYADHSLAPNLELNLVMEHPKSFQIQAKVIWCQYQTSSNHVITAQPFAYRIGIAFRFTDKAQEDAFKAFCSEMIAKYDEYGNVVQPKKPEEVTAATTTTTTDAPAAETQNAAAPKEETPAAATAEAPVEEEKKAA